MRGSFLRQLQAEVILGWHRAVRGALVWALVAVPVLALWVLPGQSDQDGVQTGYGMVLVWAFLLVAALWCGGTAYAFDRERHRLTLTFTKPLARWTLWWGRCLGTLAPFAVVVVLVWGLLVWRPLPAGRTVQAPQLPDINLMAQAELSRLALLKRVPEGVSQARLLRAVREDLMGRHTELRSHEARTYRFAGMPLGAAQTGTGSPSAVRLSGAPFLGARDSLALEVEVACGGRRATLRPTHLLERGFELPLPNDLLQPGEAVEVVLRRLDTHEAASVLYRERTDLALLFPGQSATVNLTVFCGILLLTLALAVALGTALGCSFSLPVTLFVGTLAILSITSASLSPETTVADETVNLWARISAWVSWGLAMPFRDLVHLQPLRALLEGEAITVQILLRLWAMPGLPWMIIASIAALCSPVLDEDR